MKRLILLIALMLITFALVAWGYVVTRPTRHIISRTVDNWRWHEVDLEGRASLAALMPFFHRCISCCYVNRNQIIAQIEAMYEMLERTPHGDVVYPDFFGGFSAGHIGGVPGSDRLVTHVVRSKIEYARVHEAFSSLVAEPRSYSYAEFSFAQLLETQRRVEAIISEREGCFYAQTVQKLGIAPALNILHVAILGNDPARGSRDSHEILAGFKRYVYDSPMIDFTFDFHLPLNGGTPRWWLPSIIAVPVILLAALVLYLMRQEVKRKSTNKLS